MTSELSDIKRVYSEIKNLGTSGPTLGGSNYTYEQIILIINTFCQKHSLEVPGTFFEELNPYIMRLINCFDVEGIHRTHYPMGHFNTPLLQILTIFCINGTSIEVIIRFLTNLIELDDSNCAHIVSNFIIVAEMFIEYFTSYCDDVDCIKHEFCSSIPKAPRASIETIIIMNDYNMERINEYLITQSRIFVKNSLDFYRMPPPNENELVDFLTQEDFNDFFS